jgi:hypothetical protein
LLDTEVRPRHRKHYQERLSGNNTNTDTSQEAVDNIEILEVDMNRTNTCMKDMDNTAFRQVDIISTDIRGT